MPSSSPRPHRIVHRHHELEAKAHHLRHNPTFTEQRLWSALKGNSLGLPSAVKWSSAATSPTVCAKALLVVEVDGEVHLRRQHLDAHRDEFLQRASFRILRIPTALVTRNLEAAVILVRTALLL